MTYNQTGLIYANINVYHTHVYHLIISVRSMYVSTQTESKQDNEDNSIVLPNIQIIVIHTI